MGKIYLKMNGACGNQFFQYAFARIVQEKVGGNLFIDYEYVRKCPTIWEGSDNLLRDFNVVPYQYLEEADNPKLIWFFFIKIISKLCGMHAFEKRTYKYYLWIAEHLERLG